MLLHYTTRSILFVLITKARWIVRRRSRETITSVRPVIVPVHLLKYQLQFALVIVMFSP